MKRWMLTLFVLVAASATAKAHFIWIVPDTTSDGKAKVVFSDSLEPDGNVDIKKISQTKFFARDAAGKVTPLTATLGQDAYLLETPSAGPRTIGGVCLYGISQRGDTKPALLKYYPKLVLGQADAGKAWDTLNLDIVPTAKAAGRFVVLFEGKPVADTEVAVLAPKAEKSDTLKTDAHGEFTVGAVKPGWYAIRALHVENAAGEQDGKKYAQVRSWATLVINPSATRADTGSAGKAVVRDNPPPDAAATRLLADARAARAEWANFPGFNADIEVYFNGQLHRGQVMIDAKGKAVFSQLNPDAEKWAKGQLGSIVGHRLSSAADYDTPCAFAAQDAEHPLGREVLVLNDEMHSSYRVKDKQIMVVNRAMGETRFTITVQENRLNAEGKYLPSNYVVSYWDGKSGELRKTDAHTQTWTRVGTFDLPALARVVTADKELTARSLTLSNHRLMAR